MNIICKLFGHKWEHCRCLRCSKIQDENHFWIKEVCSICNKKCSHDWNGCRCRICRKVRDEGHVLDEHCWCNRCNKYFHVWEKIRDAESWHEDLPIHRRKCKTCGKIEEYQTCPSCRRDISLIDTVGIKKTYKCSFCGHRVEAIDHNLLDYGH